MIEILYQIFQKVLYMSMVGSIVGGAILTIIKFLGKRLSAKWKASLLLIPFLLFIILLGKITINVHTEIPIFTNVNNVSNNNSFSQRNNNKVTNSEKTSNYQVMSIIWASGCIVSTMVLVVSNIKLKCEISELDIIKDDRLNQLLENCKVKLKIKKKIDIRIKDKIKSPCIYGIVKTNIVLPRKIKDETTEIISNIFMHELSHYKRKDIITNLILLFVLSIHWFNPFAYILFKETRKNIELATDEMATLKMNKEERKKYGFTLISLLEKYDNEGKLNELLCMTNNVKNMEERIIMIKNSKKYKKSILLVCIAIVFAIVLPFMVNIKTYATNIQTNEVKNEIKNEEDNGKNVIDTGETNNKIKENNDKTANEEISDKFKGTDPKYAYNYGPKISSEHIQEYAVSLELSEKDEKEVKWSE